VKIGLRVEEPSWIEVDRADDVHGADRQLKGLIEAKKRPTIVLVMLGNERQYKSFKSMCYSNNIISQCVRYQNFGKGMNMSVASNVLRQINSKLGGDLYQLKFSQNISPKTMLIGIDVCHSGPMSIVGFCATINETRSQYWSERIVQKKG
jgi:aubergine-like protein